MKEGLNESVIVQYIFLVKDAPKDTFGFVNKINMYLYL